MPTSSQFVQSAGATSKLATKLGYCKEAPKGVCSRAFVEGGTHNTNFDGVCFYQPESLPGYSAIFKHPKVSCYPVLGALLTGREPCTRCT